MLAIISGFSSHHDSDISVIMRLTYAIDTPDAKCLLTLRVVIQELLSYVVH